MFVVSQLKPKEILEKYDEEIQGKKKEKFELGNLMSHDLF